jgi:glycosyltransferase involved in cell wall biosynthesis
MSAARRHVRLLAQFNQTGVGRHCENAYFSMMRQRPLGTTLEYVHSGAEGPVRRALAESRGGRDVTVFFARHPPQFVRAFSGRKAIWWFFESESLPPRWIQEIEPYDLVLAPSAWAGRVLRAHGVGAERLRVVESGIPAAIFRPDGRSAAPRAQYVFLSVGKYEKRKSIDEIVAAFQAEFPPGMPAEVRLWLKADFPLFPERVVELARRLAPDPRIRVISGHFSDEQMAELYRSADAFVFPSKAEGFGLPCLEAMACGLPAIATAVSAQTAYLDGVAGLYRPVEYTVAPIDDEDYRRFYSGDYAGHPYGNWALPSIGSLRAAMRELYEQRDAWRERGQQAGAQLRERFSWDAIGRKALAALD